MLHRLPSFDILWTAGPDIAFGALLSLEKANKKVIVGTFDWSSNNIKLIEEGKLAASFGGHFMQPGWSLTLLYDYLHGLDFSSELGTLIVSDLLKLDISNIETIKPLISEASWHTIDFQRYSKCNNDKREFYEFTLS